MADGTYQPLVYMMQGGDELVIASGGLATVESGGIIDLESGGQIDIASGGEISVESGGTIDVESGGGIDIESGGDITVESGGKIIWPVSGATSSSVGSTTLAALASDGVSFITSSGDTRKFNIGLPYLGAHKYLFNTAGTTGSVLYFSTTTDAGIITTGAHSTAHLMIVEGTTSSALAGWCHLVGLSTSRWLRVAHSPTTQWVIASTSS